MKITLCFFATLTVLLLSCSDEETKLTSSPYNTATTSEKLDTLFQVVKVEKLNGVTRYAVISLGYTMRYSAFSADSLGIYDTVSLTRNIFCQSNDSMNVIYSPTLVARHKSYETHRRIKLRFSFDDERQTTAEIHKELDKVDKTLHEEPVLIPTPGSQQFQYWPHDYSTPFYGQNYGRSPNNFGSPYYGQPQHNYDYNHPQVVITGPIYDYKMLKAFTELTIIDSTVIDGDLFYGVPVEEFGKVMMLKNLYERLSNELQKGPVRLSINTINNYLLEFKRTATFVRES